MRIRGRATTFSERIYEAFDSVGMGRMAGTANAALVKAGRLEESAAPLFWNASAGAFAAGIALNGTPWVRGVSALNTIHTKTCAYCAPLAQDLSLALAPPIAKVRKLRRYGFDLIAWSDALTTTPFAIQWTTGGTGLFSQWTAATGIEIISDSGINAGRWTVQYRRTNVGAIVVHTDTGISPLNNPQAISMVYNEGNPATLVVSIGGVVKAVVTAAQLPILPQTGNEFNPKTVAGFNPGGAAGRIDSYRDAHFYIDEQ